MNVSHFQFLTTVTLLKVSVIFRFRAVVPGSKLLINGQPVKSLRSTGQRRRIDHFGGRSLSARAGARGLPSTGRYRDVLSDSCRFSGVGSPDQPRETATNSVCIPVTSRITAATHLSRRTTCFVAVLYAIDPKQTAACSDVSGTFVEGRNHGLLLLLL